jgi:hypothetical protein
MRYGDSIQQGQWRSFEQGAMKAHSYNGRTLLAVPASPIGGAGQCPSKDMEVASTV